MLKIQRQQQLLNVIKQDKFITAKNLMEVVPCSHATLQRDLSYLEEIGEITRTYGGISYIGMIDNTLMNKDYLMYNRRKTTNLKEKIAIGKTVQQVIDDGDIIFLTHGTTTSQIVKNLNPKKNITIITDGVDIINECLNHPNISVLTTGGMVNFKSMQIEHNPYIVNEIKHINIKKLIMGVGGISEMYGITFYDYASFSFLKDIVQKIEEIIVVADHSKFGNVALANFLTLDRVSKIITDEKTDKTQIDYLLKKGIECIIANDDDIS